jgi:hypothetical protein
MGSVDIRLCLTGDGKHRSESSSTSVEVARGMRSGGRSSCPMITKPGAKGLGLPKESANGQVARQLAGDEQVAVVTLAGRKKR